MDLRRKFTHDKIAQYLIIQHNQRTKNENHKRYLDTTYSNTFIFFIKV